MPTRSSGCLTCRKRKIRCDLARPGCERCAVHGVRCPGYSRDKPVAIGFKDQTDITARRAEERYRLKASNSKAINGTNGSTPSSTTEDANDTSRTPISVAGRDGIEVDFEHTSESASPDQSLTLFGGRTAASPTFIRSPSAERTQIYEEFLVTYLPKVKYGAQNGHFSFYQAIVQKQSDQPALERSMDALSLLQLGSLYKDQRLLKEALRQYGLSLRDLGSCIARGDFLHDDDILAAITCLAQCELYGEIGSISEGWGKHVEGANQLVAARGPQSFKSELALLLYSNMRHAALLYALISRKAPFLASPAWRALSFQSPLLRDESTKFYDVAIQIPGMLQRHDEIDLNSPTAVADIDRVLKESTILEMKLRNWYAGWQAGAATGSRKECELRPINEFETFTALVSDRTFDHAFMFPDFLVAYLYSIYWMAMYYLRANIQSLHKLRHRILEDWYPESNEAVPGDELLDYILNLCRCIPFFVEPVSNSAGHIGIFMPMRTAAFYFTDHGHWQWLKWVGAVRNNVFVKGLAPPRVERAREESSVVPLGELPAT